MQTDLPATPASPGPDAVMRMREIAMGDESAIDRIDARYEVDSALNALTALGLVSPEGEEGLLQLACRRLVRAQIALRRK